MLNRFKCANLTCMIVLAVLMGGCVSASFNVPNNRFMTPENNGSFLRTKAAVGYGSKSKMTLADVSSVITNTVEKPKAQTDDGVFALAEMSLVPMVDVFYGATGVGLKVQVLGESTEKAEAGNISLAFAVAGENATNKNTTKGTSGSESSETVGAAKYIFVDTMALVGYRASINNLIYLNVASNFIRAKGSITSRSESNGLTTVSEVKTPSYRGRETSFLLGLQSSFTTFFWMIEPGYSLASIGEGDQKAEVKRFTLGGTLGVKF